MHSYKLREQDHLHHPHKTFFIPNNDSIKKKKIINLSCFRFKTSTIISYITTNNNKGHKENEKQDLKTQRSQNKKKALGELTKP